MPLEAHYAAGDPTWPKEWIWAARSLPRRVPGVLGIVGHGAAGRGETVPGAPIELLVVIDSVPHSGSPDRWRESLAQDREASRMDVRFIESYQLGWIRPSVFQQSLLSGAVLLWGDPAVIRVIPSWRPDQLDPRLGLLELAGAESDLATGWPALACFCAAGALLIGRRAYVARFDQRPSVLQRAWPEALGLPASPSVSEGAAFVSAARRLLSDWLFTWEREGPGAHAIARYNTLWQAAQAANAL